MPKKRSEGFARFVDDPATATLLMVRDFIRKHFLRGAKCPACDQPVRAWAKTIDSSMAFVLLKLYRELGESDQAIHVPSFLAGLADVKAEVKAAVRGDWAKLKHWGLIEEAAGAREDGNPHAGYYRLTELGRLFARDRVRLRRTVYLYNAQKLDDEFLTELGVDLESEKTVSIREALTERFNYNELFNETPLVEDDPLEHGDPLEGIFERNL